QNVADFMSDPFIIQIHQTATPAWLNFVPAVQSAFHVERVIRAGPDYVIYRLAFKFPSEVIKAAVKAGAQAGPASGAFGPAIPAWELRYEGFSDGRGRVSGTAGTFAELKGKRFAAAGRTSELTYGGGVEGVIRVDGQDKWRLLELWAILRGSGKVKGPKWPLPAAPLVYVQLSGSLDLEGRLGAEENRATEQIDFMPNIYLRVEPGAEAAFVAGEKGLAWAEVAAGVKARGDFQFYQSPFVRSVLLRSYVRLAAGVLWFEKVQEWTWTWVIVGRQGQAAELWLVGTPAATGGEWRPRARDHQRDPAGPLAGHAVGAGLTESYPFADPAAVYLGNGRTLAVWVTDDGSKPQHQALELRSAVWDGVQWGAPVSVTTDLIVDTQPTLVAAPGGAVAFWTRHRDAITGSVPTTPTQLFPQMEIAYAAYDALHNSWSAPQYLTHNGQMDFLPNAASAFTRTMALWLRDPDNNFPTFPTDAIALNEEVYYAVRADADWIISPTLALPHIATAEQPQFVYNGLWAALVWSQDGDGNPTTLTDREVLYSTWNAAGAVWSPPQAITANGVADLSPRLALDSAGLAHLLWVQELADPDNAGDVYQRLYHAAFDGSAWSAPALVREEPNIEGLQLLAAPGNNLTAIWRAASDELSDLYHIFYDAQSGAWTSPAALTQDRALEWAYDAVWDDANGRVFLALLQREMGSQTVEIEFPLEMAGRDARFAAGAPQITETVPISLPTFGRSNLLQLLHAPAPDLTLTAADIALTPANPRPGSAALISATVRNAGDLAANPVKVAFYDGDPAAGGLLIGQAQSLGGPLTGGMTATLAVHWTVPAAPMAHTLYVKVDPQHEVAEGDETNNQAVARAALPDLRVAYGYADYANAGTITLTARISNTGGSPASNVLVELRQGDIAGTAIATRTLSALPAGTAQDVTFVWQLSGAAPISYAFWALADPADAVAEGDETNNSGILWADIRPDVTLTAADIAGFEPVVVTVRNSGSVTATAVTVALHRDQITGTLLYSGTVGAIAPGGAQTFTPTIPPGSYDLFVEIDPADAIAELDESNNLAAHRVDVAVGIKRLYLPLIMR
ncbi:MAG: hypothetical protein QG637_457, partial [Chloroflexota bacterium]|nr:hypothetical protein [Chloroflexota bacterium]